MRHPKALLRLAPTGRAYQATVRLSAEGCAVRLGFHRDDAKGAPAVVLSLDEAQALLRVVQSAVDEAYRQAKLTRGDR